MSKICFGLTEENMSHDQTFITQPKTQLLEKEHLVTDVKENEYI